VEYEFIPLIKEYWFDEPFKVEQWTLNLQGAIHG
jgi:5-methylcytosine-specific restriction protein B